MTPTRLLDGDDVEDYHLVFDRPNNRVSLVDNSTVYMTESVSGGSPNCFQKSSL